MSQRKRFARLAIRYYTSLAREAAPTMESMFRYVENGNVCSIHDGLENTWYIARDILVPNNPKCRFIIH